MTLLGTLGETSGFVPLGTAVLTPRRCVGSDCPARETVQDARRAEGVVEGVEADINFSNHLIKGSPSLPSFSLTDSRLFTSAERETTNF